MIDPMQSRSATQRRRWPQFTIKSALVTMLVIGLVVGWLTDRYQTQIRQRQRIEEQVLLRQDAEARLERLADWYATEHSLERMPTELRDLIEDATPREMDPQAGFRLFRVRNAHVTLAYAGLHGNSFRVRGGPLRYELLAEDLSEEEPRVVYRSVGPESDALQNSDGVFTYCRPRVLFKPHRVGADTREPSGEEYIITFSQGAFAAIKIPAHEVWPDWVYTAPGVGRLGLAEFSASHVVLRENQPTRLFLMELTSSDGRKARVQLLVTCQPRISIERDETSNQFSKD